MNTLACSCGSFVELSSAFRSSMKVITLPRGAILSRDPGFDPRRRQEKEVPTNTLVCSCGSFVELSSAFRSLSGDNLTLASHPRMGQSNNSVSKLTNHHLVT